MTNPVEPLSAEQADAIAGYVSGATNDYPGRDAFKALSSIASGKHAVYSTERHRLCEREPFAFYKDDMFWYPEELDAEQRLASIPLYAEAKT